MSALPKHTHEEWYTIAERALPGGGLGGYALPPEARFIFARGQGSRLWSSDGNEYADYVGGAGALILGHSHAAVVAAAQQQAARGMHIFGTLSDVGVHLAARLLTDIPCAEKIAFATTGSEATAYALRAARAFTKRDKILKFEGAYHGNHDYALVSTFPPQAGGYPRGVADTGGQPITIPQDICIAPYNNVPITAEILRQGDIAAVIVEPVQRIIAAQHEFLAALRQLCDDHGTVLIFDEVVTGFRVGYGGAQATSGIIPDLATFGKIIGGGGPLAAIAGRADIIDLASPQRRGQEQFVYMNGTLHGNPMAAAMTLAMLDELQKPGVYHRLEEYTREFCAAAQQVLAAHDLPAIVVQEKSLWQILFMTDPPQNYADILAGDNNAMRRLDVELLKRGQYVLPGVRRFTSLAHTPDDLQWFVASLDAACHAFKKNPPRAKPC